MRPSSPDVDLVCHEINHSGSTPSSRPPECASRLREPSAGRLERLAPEQMCVQEHSQPVGRLPHRSVCEFQEHSAGKILQLETRSIIPSSGCPSPELERSPLPIPLPTLLTNWTLPPKIKEEEVQAALLVAPLWPAQTWFPVLLEMVSGVPRLLPPDRYLVTDPLGNTHPLQIPKRLNLVAWTISGNPCKRKEFLDKLPISTAPHGGTVLPHRTTHVGRDGSCGVIQDKELPLRPL